MATAVETFKNFMDALKNYSQDDSSIGRVALDDAVRRVSYFSSLKEAKNALTYMMNDTETYPDSDTRLKEVTGMVLGAEGDFSVDTGAITGYNAGGSTVKDAQWIVPEGDNTVDLSTLPMPEPGSTTPITYTGDDGKTFTFYVKWPSSFTSIVYPSADDSGDTPTFVTDSKYLVDLDTFDPNETYSNDMIILRDVNPTYGQMKSAITTAIKGLYNYWLREGAKLNYDSLGLALDGQTIDISFGLGPHFDFASAVTSSFRYDKLPADHISLSICLLSYGKLNPTNPNGSINLEGDGSAPYNFYLDRVVAHEMVHAVMYATGTIKENMPQFFVEGIADSPNGGDDYNSQHLEDMKSFVENPSTLNEALAFVEGTGTNSAYAAGNMLMRFIAKQSLGMSQFVGNSSQAENFRYNTKSAVITNYDENDTIYFEKTVDKYEISATYNDFQITSPAENDMYDIPRLIVRDARGKQITFNTPNGDAYVYMAPDAMEINGNNFGDGNKFEVIFGSEYGNDTIRAGNGGSYLWGGHQGKDAMFGGNGADTFVYKYGDENDTVQNADSQDSVILDEFNLDKITVAQILDNGVNLQFRDGGSLDIDGTPTNFTVRNYDSSETYRADYQNKTWTQV